MAAAVATAAMAAAAAMMAAQMAATSAAQMAAVAMAARDIYIKKGRKQRSLFLFSSCSTTQNSGTCGSEQVAGVNRTK